MIAYETYRGKAPARSEEKRKCDNGCGTPLNSYSPTYDFPEAGETIYLCGACDRKRRYETSCEDALEFVGRDAKRREARERSKEGNRKRKRERNRALYAKKTDKKEKPRVPPKGAGRAGGNPAPYLYLNGLRDARQASGATQAEVGALVGMSQWYVSQLECGKKRANRTLARSLARKLKVKLSDLENEWEEAA